MFRQLKRLTIQLMSGANIATVAVMALVGMSDRLSPADHPLLSVVGLTFPFFIICNFAFLVFWLMFYKRGTLIPLIGFILCYFPIRTYSPLNITGDTPEGAVKVMSYNVANYGSPDIMVDSLNPIFRYIRDSGADIVCIQEGTMSEPLVTYTGDAYPYRDSVLKAPSGTSLVLLSKHPIVGKEQIEYSSKSNASAAFKIVMDGDTVIIINNHFESTGLSLEERAEFRNIVKGNAGNDTIKEESKKLITKLGDANRRRAPQAEAVAEYVRRHKGKSIILFGDFNDNPISYTRRILADELTDCYVATANGPGISYNHNAIFVRIDNIMCSGQWQPYNFKVDRSIDASDHYPIYGWLEKASKQAKKQ
ncbi:endonuclease/exonuclease/phosphatase family protein [Xylanibacter caecicola]|uniref:endonuclease/exonuclease/phosphatase family protein n=1 Tax=Xylanibacter caecicola TaxID=2736294 RepID=UPI0025841012|nr:endonuclease/exonuclease/phosphatase family protein [Xylanibacter caecicola]